MKKVMVLAGLVLAVLTGCVSYHTERDTQALASPSAGHAPNYRTEWKISNERTTAHGSAQVWFSLFVSGDAKYAEVPGFPAFFPTDRAVQKAKSAATYEACEKTKADALLGVAYKYKVTNYFYIFSTVDCEVVGYPANVTGLKLQEDQPILIDKTKGILRLKPWETLKDYSSSAE
ncbi:MAG: hypothetical protein IJV69_02550 [Kiritimatiellae bacterium]|nr:hypothetical protein [Kiritimatiellia bacterium]